jgi:Ca2+-binding EF-hand superfamily protein
LLRGDANDDRKLNRDEAMGLIRPHFELFDADNDQLLDSDELKKVVQWLNDPKNGILGQFEKTTGDHHR